MPEADFPKDLSHSTKWQSTAEDATAGIRNVGDHKSTDPQSLRSLRFSDNQSGTDVHSIIPGGSKNTKPGFGYWATPRGLKERVSFARPKSLQQLIVEDKEKLERARRSQVAKDIKAKRDAENKVKEDQKKADKELAKRYNKEKKRRQAEEKRNSMKWGGIVRGFDPNAGLLRCAAGEDTIRHSRIRHVEGQQNSASLTEILHPKLDKTQTWGVEHGSLGKKARFGISSPIPSGNLGGSGFDGGDD